MEKIPKQAVDSDSVWKEIPGTDIGYGPRMERRNHVPDTDFSEESVPDSVEQTSEREWLSPAQRKQLHILLLSLGISVMPPKEGGMAAVGLDSATASGARTVEMLTEQTQAVPSLVARQSENENETEKLDAFTAEVENSKAQIDEVDIALTKLYAEKSVVGAPEYSRKEYVREAIQFEKWDEETGKGVPPIVEAELRRLMPGLCAQESRFDADRVSRDGAASIFQIMPKYWEHYGGKPSEYKSLKKSVEIAGKHISALYRQLNARLREENLNLLRTRFNNDESAFQKELMVPLLINSYQTGDGRMAEAVKLYLAETPVEAMPAGKDLYLAIADFAEESKAGAHLKGYRKESRDYVFKVIAFNDKLDREG